MSALPPFSDVDLLCYGERVINLDSEIADRALDLCVTQQARMFGRRFRGRRVSWRVAATILIAASAVGWKAEAATMTGVGTLPAQTKTYTPVEKVAYRRRQYRRAYRRGYYGYGYGYPSYGYAYPAYPYYGYAYRPYGYYGYGWRPGISIGIGRGWSWGY